MSYVTFEKQYFPQTTFISKICTNFAQTNARTTDRRVRFPVTIRHRTSKAKIYAPGGKFAYANAAQVTTHSLEKYEEAA